MNNDTTIAVKDFRLETTILQHIYKNVVNIIDTSFDIGIWSKRILGIDLWDNQIDIVENVVNNQVRYLQILEARGGGKTYGVCVGLLKLCGENADFKVGVTAPSSKQASRLLKEVTALAKKAKGYNEIDWESSTVQHLVFKNGAEITSFSGNEVSLSEGFHFHLLIVDEAHLLSDNSFKEKLLPMVGSFAISRIIKIGVPKYRNHFFESYKSDLYKKLIRKWTECPILLQSGSLFIDGKEYSKLIIERMPLNIKRKMFPSHPELHIQGEMSDLDFLTQYEMEWHDDINLELNEQEKKLMIGIHSVLPAGLPGEMYFGGLDFAGGALITGEDTDSTALSIWRFNPQGIREKVASFFWQGDINIQSQEILQIIHPQTGLFPCSAILADYGWGGALVDIWASNNIPITGILYKSTEPVSGKNYKNALFNFYKIELNNNKIKYPAIEQINKDLAMKESWNQWETVERQRTKNLNDIIEAHTGYHDDAPNSDVLAVWCMSKHNISSNQVIVPALVSGVKPLFGGVFNNRNTKNWMNNI